MKRITLKQRILDVRVSLKHRTKLKLPKKPYCGSPQNIVPKSEYKPVNDYINLQIKKGLIYEKVKNKKNGLILHLPEVMDFDEHYDVTIQHIDVISQLVQLIHKNGGKVLPRSAYNLASVNFDNLKCISTEAALVLTAEISNWEDTIRNKLRPSIKKWNESIYSQFHDLGFFDLFENKPTRMPKVNSDSTDKKLVRYKKGNCESKRTAKELRHNIRQIVGDEVDRWNFLHGGLDEAITNVTHHAYPSDHKIRPKEKCWYLTASYSKNTKELKVAFFDQGVGIPNTLETSKIKEKIIGYIAKFSQSERKLDEVLLKAAVEVGRTSTGDPDRGNGLPDLLEFIRQRGNGELSILSGFGHYKFAAENSNEDINSKRLSTAIPGTLIVWNVTL